MSNGKLLVDKSDKIAWITFNRPEVHNALDREMMTALHSTLRQLENDDDVHVVVLRGAGEKTFTAGADIKEPPPQSPEEKIAPRPADIFLAMAELHKPIICSVQGNALGGGCGLVAASDMAIASERAVFGLPEINMGIFPTGILVPIVRSIGKKKAFELMFTGMKIDAREAERIGLVNRVVPHAELEAATLELSKSLASKKLSALRKGKEALNSVADMEFKKSLKYCSLLFSASE